MSEESELPDNEEVVESIDAVASAASDFVGAAVQPITFGAFSDSGATADEDQRNLDLLLDIQIPVSVEVGASQMSLSDILKLVPGSIIALDKKAEEPVDLRVNGKLVARGEVVMVDDSYGLRITQIIDPVTR